uniref:UspA domain-containing protein n=1 Tax=Manihot esculenta TaxID=3983 RepID=A0A2C9WH16_MANES
MCFLLLLIRKPGRRRPGFFVSKASNWLSLSKIYTNIEIIVREGDQEGGTIAALVREMGAFALVVGLHDQSFLYKLAMAHNNVGNILNCKVVAIKQPGAIQEIRTRATPVVVGSSTNMDFSLIEIASLEVPDIPAPKVAYKICPDPYAVIWRWRKSRRKSGS